MFERFTERARQVVILAQEEVRTLRHERITTGHLLVGLMREEEGLAARALESFNVEEHTARNALLEIIPRGPEGQPSPGQVPFTASCKRVLELSLREALSLGHNYIGTEHILLAIVRDSAVIDEGAATNALAVLRTFGVGESEIRNEVIRMLSGTRDRPPHSSERDALFAQRERDRLEAQARQQPTTTGELRQALANDPTAILEALAGTLHTMQALLLALNNSLKAPQAPADSHLYDLADAPRPGRTPTPDVREPVGDAEQQMQADRDRQAAEVRARMESPESSDAT